MSGQRESLIGKPGVSIGIYRCNRCEQCVEIAYDVVDGLAAGDWIFRCEPEMGKPRYKHAVLYRHPSVSPICAATANVGALLEVDDGG